MNEWMKPNQLFTVNNKPILNPLQKYVFRFELEIAPGPLGQIYHTLLFPDKPLKIKFKERCPTHISSES